MDNEATKLLESIVYVSKQRLLTVTNAEYDKVIKDIEEFLICNKDNVMPYNLGDYRYNKGKIYQQVFWFWYTCIDSGPYTYMQGVREVNELCGIVE